MASAPQRKRPLSRPRILRAAVSYADRNGLDRLNMRVLATRLGAGAMSLYNHVASKDDLVDGMVDLVAEEIATPEPSRGWRAATREIAVSAHRTFMKHPWVPAIWSTRGAGPAKFAHQESILRVLRKDGFSVELACRGYHAITMHTVGFTLQALDFPRDAREMKAAASAFLEDADPDQIPYFVEHVRHHVAHPEPSGEFLFVLDIILDGLERKLDEETNRRTEP